MTEGLRRMEDHIRKGTVVHPEVIVSMGSAATSPGSDAGVSPGSNGWVVDDAWGSCAPQCKEDARDMKNCQSFSMRTSVEGLFRAEQRGLFPHCECSKWPL